MGDVILEGLRGCHNYLVQDGLKLSFFLFLFREFMFFFSIFWVFFDASLSPSIELGCTWPPFGLHVPSPLGLPLLGTCILLSSGVSVTLSHSQLLSNHLASSRLSLTLFFCFLFLFLQGLEYSSCSFTIRDGVYGSLFYFSTGFHGIHVMAGGLLLSHCLFRLCSGHFSSTRHLEFECSILYWHFVDVV